MHALAPLIKDLAVILGVASIVALLCQLIRQPVVLGYLIAGAIVGPYTPPYTFITDIPNLKIISELGVIFLMFSLGLEFSFHKLKRAGFSASLTGSFEVISMLGIGYAAGRFLMGWPFFDSLFLGAALSISSTTVIIKAFDDLKLKTKRFAELVATILIVEDLLAILLLVGLSTLAVSHQLTFQSMLWPVVKLVLVVCGWFLLGYFLIPSLFRRIAHYASDEMLTIISIALCLFLVCVAAYFDYSTALGAFIIGSILAETKFIHRIEHLVRPIRDIFGAVFFVSIGMLLDFRVLITDWPSILLLAGITITGKIIITSMGAFVTGQSLNTSIRTGFSVAQIGEFSFIIVALGIALQVTQKPIYPLIIAVSAITTFATPHLIKFSAHLAGFVEQKLSHRAQYFLSSYSAWVYRALATTGKNRDIALVKLFLNGVTVAVIFTLTQYRLLSYIIDWLPSETMAKSLAWVIALSLSSPFVWGMFSAGKEKARFITTLVAIVEVSILSLAYFQTWFIAALLAIIALNFFQTLYKHLDKSYSWFETQWIKNFENRSSRQFFYRELAPWDTQLVEIEVNHQSPLVGKTLGELLLPQKFGVNIVAIHRESNMILAPRGNQTICAHDMLIVLGHDEKMEEFVELVQTTQKKEDDDDTFLDKFTLKTIVLDKESSLLGKSIRDSHIREKTNGLVVGLERNNVRILNPDVAMTLEVGDLLLIVGEKERLETLGSS